MSQSFEDSQKKQSSSIFSKLLQERIEKANPRCKLTTEETKRLNKLEGIANKLKRGENVQNRQLMCDVAPASKPTASKLDKFLNTDN